MDGLRTQAGQAGGVQLLFARATDRFAHIVGETACCQQCATSSRSTRTRNCRAIRRQTNGRGDGPSAQPARVRLPAPPSRRGLRHLAAAGRREPAELPAFLVRAAVRGRRGGRPLHARRVGPLPGSVRRRVVHRQGHLRRGRLRAVLRRLSREHHPEPRPAGKRPCPVGAAERRGAVRGVPLALPDGRQPAAPLDARRLADRAGGCCRRSVDAIRRAESAIRSAGCRGGRSSTTSAAA